MIIFLGILTDPKIQGLILTTHHHYTYIFFEHIYTYAINIHMYTYG